MSRPLRRIGDPVVAAGPAEVRIRLIGMATGRGIAVIGVDPAYTSRWGAQYWRKPLQQQTSDPAAVTVHHGAAAAIGRRGLGLAIRRRPAGPARDSGRVRAHHRPGRKSRRAPHHDGAKVLAHRHAHNDDQACRSTR
jgi:hypothetical protein